MSFGLFVSSFRDRMLVPADATPTDSVPPQLHNRRSLMVSLHLPDNLKLMDLSRHYLMDTAKVKAGDVDSSVDVSHLLEDSSSDEDDEIDD